MSFLQLELLECIQAIESKIWKQEQHQDIIGSQQGKLEKCLIEFGVLKFNLHIDYLHFSPEKASVVIEKTIRSAIANLMQIEGNNDLDPDTFKD